MHGCPLFVTALKKQEVELAHELHLALMINHIAEVRSCGCVGVFRLALANAQQNVYGS